MSRKSRGESWDAVSVPDQRQSFYKLFDQMDFPEYQWTSFRLIGGVYRVGMHWVPVIKKQGDKSSFPMLCRKNNEKEEDQNCPCCDCGFNLSDTFYSNAISRDEQDNKPAKAKPAPPKAKYRKKGDKWWSPVKVTRFAAQIAKQIKSLSDLNRHRGNDGKIRNYPVAHEEFGCDLDLKYDPTGTGSGMYNLNKGNHSPLTKEEKAYLLYDLDGIYECVPSEDDMLKSIKKAYNDDLLEEDKYDLRKIRKIISDSVADGEDPGMDDEEPPADVYDMGRKEIMKLVKAKKLDVNPNVKLKTLQKQVAELLKGDEPDDFGEELDSGFSEEDGFGEEGFEDSAPPKEEKKKTKPKAKGGKVKLKVKKGSKKVVIKTKK